MLGLRLIVVIHSARFPLAAMSSNNIIYYTLAAPGELSVVFLRTSLC